MQVAGHEVYLADDFTADYSCGRSKGATEILVGGHRESVKLPSYPVVIYQTEVPGSKAFPPSYAEKLKRALCVWDSAPGYGTGDAVVEPGLVELKPAKVEKDIDLLFFGSLTPRRVELLTKLQDAGLAPSVHFNVFGAERDALIDRAKVVVDIKQREDDPNDKTRTFWLDSRGACVLTENDTNKARALDPFRIVEQCRALLADPWPRAKHVVSRSAELQPADVTAGIAALERALAGRANGNGHVAHHPA